MEQKEERYTIEVTKSQLRLIANCVEDCHRFMAGQTELQKTTAALKNNKEVQAALHKLKPLITPALTHGEDYPWSGGNCPNEAQRKFIAQTYCVYREIVHILTVDDGIDNTYSSPTLTCEEGGGLPIIKKVEKQQ